MITNYTTEPALMTNSQITNNIMLLETLGEARKNKPRVNIALMGCG